jgi:hypothetical protein
MGDSGNTYDAHPPEPPKDEPKKGGKVDPKAVKCVLWLHRQFQGKSMVPVAAMREDAEAAGFSVSTLYAAKDALGCTQEEMSGRKWWKLPDDDSDVSELF